MGLEKVIHVNRWGVFEVSLNGTDEGNPFVEQTLTGIFTSKDESVCVNGFYDGDGIYRIRFMPSYEGEYSFVLHATFTKQVFSGTFVVDAPKENNHGPVHVQDTYHFSYADGTPYISIGTTAYVWHLQNEQTKEQTLKTLQDSSFNKLRFCIFPKHYVYNFNDPEYFPYVGTPMDASILNESNFMDYMGKSEGNAFDKTRFVPEYFRNIEEQLQKLCDLGIEADLILFHPYDRWGFSSMTREEDELYLKYIIARFAAYRNVWWAMANEWDLFQNKSVEDFEYLANVIVKNDPYHHLRSIHNCLKVYDQSKDWITHVSYQRIDLYKTVEVTNELREQYHKPVVVDEAGYEGNIQYGWGNLTAEEEVRRFWEIAMRGGYPGHGETYLNENNILWWSHGGKLHGESHLRFGFLKQIMQEMNGSEIAPHQIEWDSTCAVSENDKEEKAKDQYIFYFGFQRPGCRDFFIDDETDYAVDVIDTWNMTIRYAGVFHGRFRIALPSKQYMAVRLKKASEADLIREVDSEYKSVRLKEEHPFVEAEEKKEEPQEIPPVQKTPLIHDDLDEEDYLEPTTIKEKVQQMKPFDEEEEIVENDLDEDISEEVEIKEEPEEVKEEDLDLSGVKEESDDEAELPEIVTASIPVFHTDDEEEKEKEIDNLDVPVSFFKRSE